MTLLDGEILWNLIWVLALCLLFYYIGEKKRSKVLALFPGRENAASRQFTSVSRPVRFWRMILFLGVIVLLFLAAARPAWGQRIMPYTSEGRDLLFVFDVSKSMLAEDVRPSRMEHAKYLVRQIVEKNPSDRYGLIAFAGDAFLECPLTIDRTSFLQTLQEFDTDTIPLGGTNVEKALSTALRAFEAAEGSSRGVILITDGDELTGDSSKVLSTLARMKIPLFVMGVGDPSQPSIVRLREKDGSVKTLKDKEGNVVRVPLNEKKLSALAAATGGIYVRSTTAYPGLERIESRIKALSKRMLDSGKQTRPIERGIYPLLGALILFFLWLFLSEKRLDGILKRARKKFPAEAGAKKKILAVLAPCLLCFSLFSGESAEKTLPPEKKEPVPEQQNSGKNSADAAPEEIYNNALHIHTQEKDLKKASGLYGEAVNSRDASATVRSRSAQNLGVIVHQGVQGTFAAGSKALKEQNLDSALQQIDKGLQQSRSAVEIYRSALRIAPEPGGIVRNLTLLQQEVHKAQDLKQKIRSLQKQHQLARENTRKAVESQKKNLSGEKGKQKDLEEQILQASDSIREMETQSRQLDQKNLQDRAKRASSEMEKVRAARKDSKEKEALAHLQKALSILEENSKKDQNKDQNKNQQNQKDQNKDQNKNQQNQKDQNKDQSDKNKDQGKDKDPQDPKDSPLPSAPSSPQQDPSSGQQEKDLPIDKEQAKGLLEEMAGEEKLLKDELKKRMKRNYGNRKVEKDW